jgi:hypothetical protein
MFDACIFRTGQPENVKRQFETAIGMTVQECIGDG